MTHAHPVSNTEELRASYERIWSTTDMYETRDYYVKCLDLASPEPGERILDVACGSGRLLLEAERFGLVLSGVDIADAAVARTRSVVPKAEVQRAEAEHLPHADETFDIVTCLGSLEHFLTPDRALEEMRRVLKPGGRAVLAIPNQFWAYDVARGWLEGAGLRHGQESENFFSLAEARDLMEGSFHIAREWPWNPGVAHMRETRPFTGRWASAAFRAYGWLRPRLPFVASYLFVFLCVKAPGDAPREVATAQGPVIPGGWHAAESGSRWTSGRAGVWLRLGSRLSADVLHDEPGQASVAIGLDAERRRLATATVTPHAWTTVSAEVPESLRGTVQRVFLDPARTWSPAEHGVRDDQRRLGVSVRRFWSDQE
ncbi:MAG: class I SAM-dependent methyltransferase [Chloroflexi bacterium]|nr:class I SAM-dependent methyltransferase [Chloroflexota bacterium]